MADPRVLIVDDSQEMAETIARYLSVRGFLTHVAANGDDALALARDLPFDLAITDLRMPGLDGLDVLVSLRALQPATRVILMTAFGGVKSAVAAIQGGAFDYLTKPFALADLRALLDKAMKAPPDRGGDVRLAHEKAAAQEAKFPQPAREPWNVALDALAEHQRTLAEVSDGYVDAILRTVDGNKIHAAAILDVDPSTIYRRQRRRGV